MNTGKLYGVGMGPGDPGLVTLRAAEILRFADVIFTVVSAHSAVSISRAIVEKIGSLNGEICTMVFSMSKNSAVRQKQIQENATKIIEALQYGKNCVFAALGDIMTYSTFGYILPIIKESLPSLDVEIVPGVTSFAHLAAKCGHVLVENNQELRVIPSFRSEQVENLPFSQNTTTVLLKTYHNREVLLKRLQQEKDISIIYGERLGMEGEFLSQDLEEIHKRSDDYLSLLIYYPPRKI